MTVTASGSGAGATSGALGSMPLSSTTTGAGGWAGSVEITRSLSPSGRAGDGACGLGSTGSSPVAARPVASGVSGAGRTPSTPAATGAEPGSVASGATAPASGAGGAATPTGSDGPSAAVTSAGSAGAGSSVVSPPVVAGTSTCGTLRGGSRPGGCGAMSETTTAAMPETISPQKIPDMKPRTIRPVPLASDLSRRPPSGAGICPPLPDLDAGRSTVSFSPTYTARLRFRVAPV